jgi:hypothetical protein
MGSLHCDEQFQILYGSFLQRASSDFEIGEECKKYRGFSGASITEEMDDNFP